MSRTGEDDCGIPILPSRLPPSLSCLAPRPLGHSAPNWSKQTENAIVHTYLDGDAVVCAFLRWTGSFGLGQGRQRVAVLRRQADRSLALTVSPESLAGMVLGDE